MLARISTRFGLVALLATTGASLASADEIDKVLASNSRSILAQLAAKKYANVGVLKFEVQTGGQNGPISFDVGTMNDSLATRLENALILALNEKNPIGIVRGASRHAVTHDPLATYETPEGRSKLFMDGYPLAWGKTTVKPDAFLVGRVQFEPDLRSAVLTLRAFDQKDPATWQDIHLACGELAVSRQMLADINAPFAVPGKYFRKRGGAEEVADPFEQVADRAVVPLAPRGKGSPIGRVPEVKRPDPTRPDPTPPDPRVMDGWKEIEALLTFKVFYDNVEIARTPEGNYPTPRPGQKVQFSLRSSERIGLVFLVNGVNTADYDRSSRETHRYVKWVLDPGVEYWVRGYYDSKAVYPFEVVSSRAQAERRLGALADPDRFGQIELHIYRQAEEGIGVMPRNTLALREYNGTADSLAGAKEQIQASIQMSARPVKKGLLVPGEAEALNLKSAEFTGSLAAKLVFTYAPVSER